MNKAIPIFIETSAILNIGKFIGTNLILESLLMKILNTPYLQEERLVTTIIL